MFAKRIISAIVALSAVLAVAGCTNPLQSKHIADAMSQMVSSPLEGYRLDQTVEPTCGIDYCNANYNYIFTSSDKDDKSTFCKKMFDWATKFGADSWYFDPEYIALPIKDYEGAAMYACFGGNQFNLAGTSDGIRWTLSGAPGQLLLGSLMNREGGLDDDRMKFHNWDEGRALLFEGTRLNMDILSAIETFRTQNPKLDPSSPSTIDKALKGVELPVGVKLIKDKAGQVHYLDIPADDVLLQRCINIKPFDETYFGFPNPKSGFTTLYILEGAPVIDEFGYTKTDACDAK